MIPTASLSTAPQASNVIAFAVKAKPKASTEPTIRLKDKADIRAFGKQYPKAFALLGVIFTVWRGSSSRRPHSKGYWAAWPYPYWCEKSGLPERTLKRQLNVLFKHGLIERDHGRHGGTRVLTFLRPSRHALELSATRPQDWTHYGDGMQEPKQWQNAFSSAPIVPQAPAQIAEDKPANATELAAILWGAG